MIAPVSTHTSVPYVPRADRRTLAEEVRKHGPDIVFDNRAGRADFYRQMDDEEFAQRAEREAGYILDVFA